MGVAAALLILLCVFVGYFFVYRKLLKGQKKINGTKFLWWGIFICYMFIVLGATLFSRENTRFNDKIAPLFYSYRAAWVYFSNSAWRNIILNFCMFIPFGFLLPLGIKRLRKFWTIYLAGFGFSLLIESTQLFLGCGTFELDDIMGNTVGAMIGYGLFAIAFFLVSKSKKEHQNAIPVILLQTPLILTFATFAIIFGKYEAQELGNNTYQYIDAYDSTKIHVTTDSTFRTEEADLTVYEVDLLTAKTAREKGEQIFEALGTTIDESRTDIYDQSIVMYSQGGSYHLWFNYRGGTMQWTNYDVLFPDDHVSLEPVTGANETEIRDALYAIGFEVPQETVFKELSSGTYQFEAAAIPEKDTGGITGRFTCKYYGAEKGIGQISNNLMNCTPYKTYAAISEQEAYEKIVNGEFTYGSNEDLEIQVMSCSLIYALDSKGYYQPNYRFQCTINEKESQITIPAIQ
ncbi:MAG: VanZ family protein [Candidatus Gastranaerophilales bacterium]|nr:VanZ family protein [Candidatus Gastranaerophilales bacterium]